jgi:hypothetical protein
VTLTWSAPNSDGGLPIRNYSIYRGLTSGSEVLIDTVGNVLAYEDMDVANGQTYYYRVSAVNTVGEGEMSNEVSATPDKSIIGQLWFWILIIAMIVIFTIIALVIKGRRKKGRRKDVELVGKD